MKIYNEIVFDKNGKVIYEDSFEYTGEISRLGGGGGSSGEVEYPAYIESSFKKLWGITGDTSDDITVNLVDVLNASMGDSNNPFYNETAYNPNSALSLVSGSPLKEMQSIHDAYETIITGLSHTTDWDAIITKAVSEVDSNLTETDIATQVASIVSTALTNSSSLITAAVASATSSLSATAITDAVSAFESEQENQHLRSIGRMAASMAENINSSAFVFALAQMEYEFSKSVDKFRTDLKLKAFDGNVQLFVQNYISKVQAHVDAYIRNHMSYEQFRTTLIDESVKAMLHQLDTKVSGYSNAVTLQKDISSLSIVSLKEQADRDIEIDSMYANWDIGMISKGGSLLANIAGGTAAFVADKPSQAQSALGGALSGASAGMMVGGPIGGVIGGVLGAAASYIK